jgi:glucose-6-phosphate isomerase
VSKNINLKNNIDTSYFNKKLYKKDKVKLSKILNSIYVTLDSKKNTFSSLSTKFNLNFKNSELTKFNKYKSIILIGMGGSALGVEAIYSFCKEKIKKKFIFLII